MTRRWMTRLVFWGLLCGLTLPRAGAEDVTVTTYYPSPRGVYDQLRTSGETDLAMNGGINDNVGIGSTPGTPLGFPSQKLHIWGKGVLPTNVWIDTGLGGPWVSLGANVANTIDLAIGPDTPLITTDLFINKNSPDSGNTLINFGAGNVGIGIVGNGVSTTPLAKLQIGSTSGVNLLEVDDGPLPDATPFVIRNDGNVGIGTKLPTAKLHVVRGPGMEAFRVDDLAGGDPSPFLIDWFGDVHIGGQLHLESIDGVASGDLHVSGGQDGIFYILNTNTAPTAFPNRQRVVILFSQAGGGAQPVATFDSTAGDRPFALISGDLIVTDPTGMTTLATFDSTPPDPPSVSIQSDLSVTGNATISGEAKIGGVASDGAGKVVCVKGDGNLGTCFTMFPTSGTCTCS